MSSGSWRHASVGRSGLFSALVLGPGHSIALRRLRQSRLKTDEVRGAIALQAWPARAMLSCWTRARAVSAPNLSLQHCNSAAFRSGRDRLRQPSAQGTAARSTDARKAVRRRRPCRHCGGAAQRQGGRPNDDVRLRRTDRSSLDIDISGVDIIHVTGVGRAHEPKAECRGGTPLRR